MLDVTDWINQHLEGTFHDKDRWQTKYLKDERFFTGLAAFAHCVLDCHDLFDPTNVSAPILRIGSGFYYALTLLCLRIVSFIPKILEEPFTRRDSVQPTAAGQSLPLSTYISLLSKILDHHTPFSTMLQRLFGIKPSAIVNRSAKLVLGQKPAIAQQNPSHS
jgi:hypothetical protein